MCNVRYRELKKKNAICGRSSDSWMNFEVKKDSQIGERTVFYRELIV